MAVITEAGHVLRAMEFYERTGMFFCVGQQAPWVDEEHPPVPSHNAVAVAQILGYKEVSQKHLVVIDAVNGTIPYGGTKLKIVSMNNALSEKAKWVYVSSYLEYDELPLLEYRQIGLYTGVTRKVGVPSGKQALLPAEVESLGTLEVLDNKKVTKRDVDKRELLTFLIQF
jgi:hypothetical protein